MCRAILLTEEVIQFTITIVTIIPVIETTATDMVIIMVMFTEDVPFLCMDHVIE